MECDPVFDDGYLNGVHGLFTSSKEIKRKPTDWGSISDLGMGSESLYGLSRTNSEIDSEKIAVMGHSRLGKTYFGQVL